MTRGPARAAAMVLAALALSSCGLTPQGDMVRDAVRDRGADAYDAGVENALWFLCNAASVGSIRRRFGGSGEQAEAYRALCQPAADVIGGHR